MALVTPVELAPAASGLTPGPRQVGAKGPHEGELPGVLGRIGVRAVVRGALGQVQRAQRQRDVTRGVQVDLEVAPVLVGGAVAEADPDGARRRPRQKRDPVAARQHASVVAQVVPGHRLGRDQRRRAAHLLQGDDVAVACGQPVAVPAPDGRPDAVDVVGGDAQHRSTLAGRRRSAGGYR